jgi:leader peptidase (prepilin peptidase)/N-methyltransferase
MFPEWTWVVGFWIGATFGSFLNVVVYRLPRGMPIWKPSYSICTVCKKRLLWEELIPLFSWIFQKGRCKCGDSKVPARYFIVEMVTGVVFAAVWYVSYCQPNWVTPDMIARSIAYFLFSAALVAAIFTDLAHYIIPDEINAAMFIFGVGANIAYVVLKSPMAWEGNLAVSVAGAQTLAEEAEKETPSGSGEGTNGQTVETTWSEQKKEPLPVMIRRGGWWPGRSTGMMGSELDGMEKKVALGASHLMPRG